MNQDENIDPLGSKTNICKPFTDIAPLGPIVSFINSFNKDLLIVLIKMNALYTRYVHFNHRTQRGKVILYF